MEAKQSIFEELCLPHLDAAYNLARLLVGRDADAQNVVQETYVRALKGLKDFAVTTLGSGYYRSSGTRLQLAQEACQTILHGPV